MNIIIYINIAGHPYEMDAWITKEQKKYIYGDRLRINGSMEAFKILSTPELSKWEITQEPVKKFIEVINNLVKEETEDEYTLCYVKQGKGIKGSIVLDAQLWIESNYLSTYQSEFQKERMNELKEHSKDKFMFDCLMEEWQEQGKTLFQNWLEEMRHPDLLIQRPEIFLS